jgi:hypothetical protein
MHYEFGNDPMKCVSNTKQKWRSIIELQILKLYKIMFLSHRLWFLVEIFLSWIFYVWRCTILFSFIMIFTYLRCYITNDVDLVICALCEKEWLKTLMDQKRKDILFSSMFFLCIFLVKIYFHMHFDHLIKFCESYHYYIAQVIWYQFIYTSISMF